MEVARHTAKWNGSRGDVACRTRAHKLNFTRLFYLFLAGSYIGYLVETAFFWLLYGQYYHRASLVLSPLNTVYGIGAVALHLSLRFAGAAGPLKLFAVGAVSGSLVEALCSWAQQAVFGTVSWDYSEKPFNFFGGSVCLSSAVAWGALALLWAYALSPGFEWLLNRIPKHIARMLMPWLLAALLADVLLSVSAVSCWIARLNGTPLPQWLQQTVGQLFPNAAMERLYESMRFLV